MITVVGGGGGGGGGTKVHGSKDMGVGVGGKYFNEKNGLQ